VLATCIDTSTLITVHIFPFVDMVDQIRGNLSGLPESEILSAVKARFDKDSPPKNDFRALIERFFHKNIFSSIDGRAQRAVERLKAASKNKKPDCRTAPSVEKGYLYVLECDLEGAEVTTNGTACVHFLFIHSDFSARMKCSYSSSTCATYILHFIAAHPLSLLCLFCE
jgi:hypothetical protein